MGDPHELLPLLREYAGLERRRKGDGVTPLEYQRWLDLQRRLGKNLAGGAQGSQAERRGALRVSTRLRVEFRSPGGFQAATIRNLSKGGLFIATPFAAEIGTSLELRIHIRSTQEQLDLPVEVVSNNVGDGFSTAALGMGVRFLRLSPEQQKQLQALRRLGLQELASD